MLYNNIISGGKIPRPGTPESFNVLAYELRGLLIKLEVHKKDQPEEQEEEEKVAIDFTEIPVDFIDEFDNEGRIQLEKVDDQFEFDEENVDFD